MPRLAGIKTKRNTRGASRKIVIDTEKHPQAIEVLKNLGLIEKSPLQKEIEENPEKFSTVDEVFDRLHERINSWEWPR